MEGRRGREPEVGIVAEDAARTRRGLRRGSGLALGAVVVDLARAWSDGWADMGEDGAPTLCEGKGSAGPAPSWKVACRALSRIASGVGSWEEDAAEERQRACRSGPGGIASEIWHAQEGAESDGTIRRDAGLLLRSLEEVAYVVEDKEEDAVRYDAGGALRLSG